MPQNNAVKMLPFQQIFRQGLWACSIKKFNLKMQSCNHFLFNLSLKTPTRKFKEIIQTNLLISVSDLCFNCKWIMNRLDKKDNYFLDQIFGSDVKYLKIIKVLFVCPNHNNTIIIIVHKCYSTVTCKLVMYFWIEP